MKANLLTHYLALPMTNPMRSGKNILFRFLHGKFKQACLIRNKIKFYNTL